mgnify:CR=1 FL=1
MSFFGSFFAALSGLQANASRLSVIGNNLANVNTTAYKSQRLRFADQMWDTIRPASGPTALLA